MKKFIPLIAIAMLVAACQDEPENNKVKHGEQLIFKTEQTSFQGGDLIGVCMDSPLSYINVKMVYSSGDLTPTNPLYWPVDMPDSAVSFMAYYPYSESYNDGGTVVFSASPDQTLDEAFRASGLLVSRTKSSVTAPEVKFSFEPKMSKLVFYLRNDSGSAIKDIVFNAYPSVQFNMDRNTFRVCGEKADIHAHLTATSEEGVNAYEAIFAPQNTTLTLTVKTADAEYTALLDTKTTFESGKQYSNSRLVVLEKGKNRPFTFTVTEAEWKDTPDFVYQEPIAGVAELEDMSEPGIYKLESGAAVPLRTYVIGSDQYSVFSASSKYGWRLMNPGYGDMFEFTSTASYSKEGASVDINVRSFGLEGFEADFSSKANVVKVSDGIAWLLDQNKDYGYIIATE